MQRRNYDDTKRKSLAGGIETSDRPQQMESEPMTFPGGHDENEIKREGNKKLQIDKGALLATFGSLRVQITDVQNFSMADIWISSQKFWYETSFMAGKMLSLEI